MSRSILRTISTTILKYIIFGSNLELELSAKLEGLNRGLGADDKGPGIKNKGL